MNRLDVSVLLELNRLAASSNALAHVVVIFTKYAPLVFAVMFVALFVRQTAYPDELRRRILLAGISGLLGLAASVVLAHFIYRARPFLELPRQVHLLLPHSRDSSFPSDHASGAAGFAAGMWPVRNPSIRWVFVSVALLVGVSRVMAGVHWPSDILGSFVIGTLCSRLILLLQRQISPLLTWVLSGYHKLESLVLGNKG